MQQEPEAPQGRDAPHYSAQDAARLRRGLAFALPLALVLWALIGLIVWGLMSWLG